VDSVVAGTNITVDNTDPANPVISATGSGGSAPTPRRITSTTTNVSSSEVDNTFYTVITSGSADATVNMFAAATGLGEKRITFINSRSSVNGRVLFTFPSGTEPENLARQLAVDPGEFISFYYSDDDRVSVWTRGETPLTPDFVRSAGNNDGSFQHSVTGSGTTAFNRDYPDTYINMENANTSPNSINTYSLPPNGTAGLMDGRGYFIQNIGPGRSGIEPESGATLFVDGVARTGVIDTPLQQSFMVLWNATDSRWDATTFDRLLFSASGSGGSAAGAGGSSDEVMADSGIRTARNEDTVAVVAGDGIAVRGIDGAQSFTKAGQGSELFLNGFALTDTGVNENTQYTYFGPVVPPEIYTGPNAATGELLSANDPVYWNATDSQVWTIDESGAHGEVGKVLTSDWLFETTPFNADVDIDSQADWDAVISKAHIKTGGNIHFDLPDTREGSSEATVVPGQQIIVHIPQGNGTAGIGVRGGELRPAPGTTGTVYTPGSRLGMTGVAAAEYTVLEAGAPGVFYYYPLNTKGIRTSFHFSSLRYLMNTFNSVLYSHTVSIQANTQARVEIQNPNRVRVTSTNRSLSTLLGEGDKHIVAESSGDATWSFPATSAGIPDNRIQRVTVDNSKRSDPILVVNDGGNYQGMEVDRIIVMGGEVRQFLLLKNGTALEATPVGRVAYRFKAEAGVLGGPTLWTLQTGLNTPSQLIEVPTGDTDCVQMKVAGSVENILVSGDFAFTGTAAADFASLALRTPGLT
jgi:hypothetical protein